MQTDQASFVLSDLKKRKILHETADEIDILINNAGAILGGDLFNIKIKDWLLSWNLKILDIVTFVNYFCLEWSVSNRVRWLT